MRLRRPLLLLLPLVAAPGAAASPFPGGVLDPAGRTAYVAGAGGIDALDLATGDVVWRTARAQVPLLVVGDRLYAQANDDGALRVRAFDLTRTRKRKNGATPGRACALESDPVALPRWVVPADGPGHSFRAAWALEKDVLVLRWQADAWSAAPGGGPGLRKHARGVARVDVHTGAVQAGPAEQAPPPPRPPAQFEKLAVRWHTAVGPNLLAVVAEDAGAAQKLVLRAWDAATGRPGPARELLRGRRLVLLPTLDGRHLFLRDAAPSPDEVGQAPGERFRWSVFTAEKGERLATLPHLAGTEAVLVHAGRAFCLVAGPLHGPLDRATVRGRSLQAVDLQTGKALWRHPLAGKPVPPPRR